MCPSKEVPAKTSSIVYGDLNKDFLDYISICESKPLSRFLYFDNFMVSPGNGPSDSAVFCRELSPR